ncbi:Mut7-C RNAse domain-containing protein [Kitasatospora atroaurantiaca]|uniref:Twitching motility protein PilT n=1 Tax=Kitasatospora atroaurantiaca TaxID=285545 RepID=A0A561EZZ8_9ACTN|nr:Mut7-C RNAse domain-containing protein [Kitasatospora atroaurantiaca]TWE21184.1 hypothetical protein FB465_6351 [Kitasatospora atroaurantiaca]
MTDSQVSVRFAPELWLFLKARHRRDEVAVAHDGTSSLGHLVESLGVPLTEVGELAVGDRPVDPSYRPTTGALVRVSAVRRPQEIPVVPLRLLLDVHLGALARRLRLVGVDTAYRNDLDDDELIERANADRRVLLTQDRALLCRRALWLGAYVRGAHPDDQLADVLGRFAPRPAPWTRCTACNGLLAAVAKTEVEELLQPGTRRTYHRFARCRDCGQVYWHGAHHAKLEAIVSRATRLQPSLTRPPTAL